MCFHSPGRRWQAGVGFREQPGVERDVAYMAAQLEAGRLAIGDRSSTTRAELMALACALARRCARIAEADPTVRDRLLLVQVKPWMVAMKALVAE